MLTVRDQRSHDAGVFIPDVSKEMLFKNIQIRLLQDASLIDYLLAHYTKPQNQVRKP